MSRADEVPVSLEPDPVIDAYKPGIDVTLLDENLKLTPDERIRKLQQFVDLLDGIRGAANRRTSDEAIRVDPPGAR
jgi:hypothetical protein